ncbi:hypothetical protein NN3_40570 [Nocardia neocaledoniensis NBRC 108232]|nr:hypothetical protein NN3_40570 [Nocardia neocaledoniensis NBRC 108232]
MSIKRAPGGSWVSGAPDSSGRGEDVLRRGLDPGCYRVRATYIKDPDKRMILVQLQPAVGTTSEEMVHSPPES